MLSNIQRNIVIRAMRIRKSHGENPINVLEGYKNITEVEKNEILLEVTIGEE